MQSLTFFFPTDFSSTISFFFLALRPPSISTLFPYTTLFRSPVRRAPPPVHAGAARGDPADGPPSRHSAAHDRGRAARPRPPSHWVPLRATVRGPDRPVRHDRPTARGGGRRARPRLPRAGGWAATVQLS